MRRTLVATSVVGLALAALPAGARGAERWLQPETLSQAGTANDAADIAVNSPGVAALIWTEFKGSRTPRRAIRVSTREPDGKWEDAEQLSGNGEADSGAVGVDPQGRITAVWTEDGEMWWATKARNQPWSAGAEIPDGDGGNPDLFVASDGTATAVWQQGAGGATVIRASRRPLGGAWSEPETISPPASFRAHVEGDTAGNVTVSYTNQPGGTAFFGIASRPNSGPWGSSGNIGGPGVDNVSELVVAPNSGEATLFWQNGALDAPLAASTRVTGTWGMPQNISGGTPGRLDLSELDRAVADGTGLVTAVWINATKVHSAYRAESPGSWTAPTPPAVIDPGDGSQLGNLQIASSATSRAYATWRAANDANRWSTRGVGPLWSAPKPIDGVPADAFGLDLAVDDTHRVAYVWSVEDPVASNVSSLAVSTYGDPLDNPQPPAPPGPAPPTGPSGPSGPSGGGGGGGGKATAALTGTPTTKNGVKFVVRMPAAGKATIVFARAGKARAAATFRRVGTVKVKLKKGRNVVRVKRVKKRKLAKGRYRATIRPKVGSRALAPVRVNFRIRR